MKFLRLTLLVALIFHFNQSFSQETGELDVQTLKKFFPEEVGTFKLDQISVVPFEDLSINGLYVSTENSDDAYFILLAQYNDAKERISRSGLNTNEANEVSYDGHQVYENTSKTNLLLFLGDDILVNVYKTSGDITIKQLYKALDAVDIPKLSEYTDMSSNDMAMDHLLMEAEKVEEMGEAVEIEEGVMEAMEEEMGEAEEIEEEVVEAEEVEEMEEDEEGVVIITEETTDKKSFDVFGRLAEKPESYSSVEVSLKKIDCETFNSDVKAKMEKQMGGNLAPWIIYLKAEQASTAWNDDGKLVFPKKGNNWLLCLSNNDLLWSPLESPMFALRVKNIVAYPDRVELEVENAKLTDFVLKGKMKMEAGDK